MKHRFHRLVIGKEVSEHMKLFGIREQAEPSAQEAEQTAASEPRPETEASVAASHVEDASQESAPWTAVSVASRTHVGKVRQNNEDAVIVCGMLCGVADGMGGHQAGETASAAARDGLIAALRDEKPDPALLQQTVKKVNRQIFLRAQADEKLRGMGTTVSVIWLGGESVYVAHVGDSRVYRMQQGTLRQITEDHSLVGEMVRAGAITREQASTHPMRNVITRALGTEGSVEVDLLTVPRRADDLWLICSDGLYDMVSNDRIAEILRSHPIEQAADMLLQAALDGGGSDNISLVLVKDREGAQ